MQISPISQLLPILTFIMMAISAEWDIGVVTDKRIDFLMDGNLVGAIGDMQPRQFLCSAFNPIDGEFYISDNNRNNGSAIVKFGLQQARSNSSQQFGFEAFISRQSSTIQGMAFDSGTSSLFWSTGVGRAIYKMKIIKNNASTIRDAFVLHKFDDEVPHGVAVDSCRQYLYWTNCNHLKPSVERSLIDGSKRQVIVNSNLYQPLGITVDQHAEKLYWSNEQEGVYYNIERSNLDGTGREIVIRGTHHQPFSLAVTKSNIYWSDWTTNSLWSLNKNDSGMSVQPKVVRRYENTTPMGIISNIANYRIKTNCEPLVALENIIHSEKWIMPFSKLSMSDEVREYGPEFCLHGSVATGNNTCLCENGFQGRHCEVNMCYNYCIDGSRCSIDSSGTPQCSCLPGRSGQRCEVDACSFTCLNGGKCVRNGSGNKTTCHCPSGFKGDRCQIIENLCKAYCLVKSLPNTVIDDEALSYWNATFKDEIDDLCDCVKNNTEEMKMLNGKLLALNMPEESFNFSNLAVLILSALALLLTFALISLYKRIRLLSRRPRINKRIVLSKSQPSSNCQRPRERCEITIEDCCNMNICETPCFEPEFQLSQCGSFRTFKSEDRAKLIACSNQSLNSPNSDE